MSAPIESIDTKMEEKSGEIITNVTEEDVTQTDETSKEDCNTPVTTLSKSQLKKLKKKEKWEQVKLLKRKAEKERYKARKRECRERGEELGPTRKQLRHNTMSKSSCKVQVVVDCDFDDYMADKDIKMLVKQVQHSYSANRRAENPLHFHCCGVNGKTRERLENLGDYKGWDVKFHAESFTEIFDKSSVVYLSSDSPNMLDTLEEDKVYVIGGLVDHNHHKGLCHRLAEEKGLPHAQLPISDYIDMKTRKVLTVNHVFEILLRFTETKDWQKAFYTVLPPRKGAVPKLQSSSENSSTIDIDQENGNTSNDKQAEDVTTIPDHASANLINDDTKEVNSSESDCEVVDKKIEKEDYVCNRKSQSGVSDHFDDRGTGEQCDNDGINQL